MKKPSSCFASRPPNAYQGVGDRCRLSERTVRDAFQCKPITYGTAMTLASVLDIPIGCFRIKSDKRGLNKGRKRQKELAGTE